MSDASRFLVYGATGYTGRLIAQHAVERGLRPILGGRDAAAVRALARRLQLEWRSFPLDASAALQDGIRDVAAVLHVAGPFSATSRPMADACIGGGVHYIDITGEVRVIEALAARDAEANAAGVVLLPGAGFDVVPSDCLAAHVVRRLPGATRLQIGIASRGGISRGTAKTMVEGAGRGTLVRRDGAIVELQRAPRTRIDFGRGPRLAVAASWGDVATAWRSTRVPNITVFFRVPRAAALAASLAGVVRPVLASPRVQRFLARQVERRLPTGPSAEQRRRGGTVLVAEAWSEDGAHVRSVLETVEAYTLTAWTAVEIARRVSAGEVEAGFQTPATAFGADFILAFSGSTRTPALG